LFSDKLKEFTKSGAIPSSNVLVYSCGPVEMMRKVAKITESFGSQCYVSMEEVMGCGFGVCLSCVVKSKDSKQASVCKDGPVFNSREIIF